MTERSTVHADFTIERTYPYSPAQVFRAFSDAAAKAAWFGEPADEMAVERLEFDFRVGGHERLAMQVKDGPAFTFDARYEDIVDDTRIVATYLMTVDGERISVTVATTEFIAAADGTTLVVTEQGTFLDGLDSNAQRKQGTEELLESLAKALDNASGHV